MAYPATLRGDLPVSQTLAMAFRPEKAGLVKVIGVVTWDLSIPLPPGEPAQSGETEPEPSLFSLAARLDIVKPGSTEPVVSNGGRKRVGFDPHHDLGKPRIVVWADTLAGAGDLGGDWAAIITNTGEVAAGCSVTTRYEVVDGNLGKIDHIVVLMLENRSFDHMLGYLRLEQGRVDIDGLTGNETNRDGSNNSVAVHHRTDTFFRSDPGHGFADVAEQLTWLNLTAGSNAGFVHNFAKKLAADAEQLPPKRSYVRDEGELAGGNSRTITFRPTEPGPITVVSDLNKTIAHSETGELGGVLLRRPGNSVPVVSRTLIGERTLRLSYVATAADLAVAGSWTCTVSNGTETSAFFATTVSYVEALHDLSSQEAPDAIMGYYNATELPAYDLLAREFLICDRWFASLPTDTFPNRLYALTGGSGGTDTTPSADDVVRSPPSFPQPTIFEVLQNHGVDWRIFFSDLPFALVFTKFAQDAQFTQRLRALSDGAASDFAHAVETGDLPSVSWIDPNFADFRESVAAASDDHPPGGITNGQRLVSRVYQWLSTSPAWSKTLLLITYDEHGGFYDHVRPPGLSADLQTPGPDGPPDDDSRFRRYGVRVPAFVVSPWVERGSVSHETYDNTSLLSTILQRFCPDAAASMGQRAGNARDVGALLSADAPRGEIPQMPEISSPVAGTEPRVRDPDSFGDVLRKSIFGF
jgi:phospholipase C